MTTSLGTSDLRTGGLIERLASPVASWLAASLFVVATVTAGVLESRVADGALRGPAALELAIPFASWWYALALFVVAAVALAHLATARDRAPQSALSLQATLPAALTEEALLRALRALGPVHEGRAGELIAVHGRSRRHVRTLAGATALFAVLTLGAWAHLRSVGLVEVGEGGVAYGILRALPTGFARFDLGADLQAEPMAAGRYRVSLGRGADVYGRAELGVGDTLHAGSRSATLMGTRPGDGAKAFFIALEGEADQRRVRMGELVKVTAPKAAPTPTPGQGAALPPASLETEVVVVGFEANRRNEGGPAVGPAIRVAWSQGADRSDVGWVYAQRPDFDARVRRSQPAVRFLGYERQGALLFKLADGGTLWPLLLAGLLALMALGAALGPSERRLCAQPTVDGWLVTAEGDASPEALTTALDQLVARTQAVTR